MERRASQDHVASAFAAEAWACFLVLKVGLENGWDRVIVEGDSLSVIKKCQSKSPDRSQIGALISNIQHLGSFFHDLKFSYVPRSGNTLAHDLAHSKMKDWKHTYQVKSTP